MISERSGNLLEDFAQQLVIGQMLVVMPIARTIVEWLPLEFPGNMVVYPKGFVNLSPLNIAENQREAKYQAECISALSQITPETLHKHTIVAFPYNLDWRDYRVGGYRPNMDLIRELSEYVDRKWFDYLKYSCCRPEPNSDLMHNIPGRAGQTDFNHMMSAAVIYHPGKEFGLLIGGDAFTHIATRGIGLPLEPIEPSKFPKAGEVGAIVQHALSLYGNMIEAQTPTSMFTQALALLEFLAFPDEYKPFKDVKRVIARYVAKSREHYDALLARFLQLTGKKDESSDRVIGYRTRIVHMGERIEQLVPDPQERRELMVELDSYIRPVIDHMVAHSHLDFDRYRNERETLSKWKQ